MEWYFGNEAENLVVPKDYEQSQMIPSPESWPLWGMPGLGSSYPKKNFDPNMTHEEITFNGGKDFYTSINRVDERSKSNNSSMSQELYNNGGSLLWNDEADFRQFAEEEARINHMDDDIFFSALLEQDPTKESTKSHENTILGKNADIIEGEMVNSQYVGRHGQSMGSSKYLKTHAFSPSTDWANGEVSTTYQMPKQYTSNNESSMEASILNDLERVTAQFTNKTRICLRDAFYRLAESSKQSLNSCQDGESLMTSDNDTLRAAETEDLESKTNVIDRAVASLIFDDACNQRQIGYNYDTEVPIRGMQKLAQPTTF